MGVTNRRDAGRARAVVPARGRDATPHRRFRVLGLVMVGGAMGTLVRALLADAAPTDPDAVPWMTLVINVTGAFVLGLLLELLVRAGPDDGRRRAARLGVGTGLLGGFTTYSTLAVETAAALRPTTLAIGLIYPVGSVVLGIGAAVVGYRLASAVGRRAPARQEKG